MGGVVNVFVVKSSSMGICQVMVLYIDVGIVKKGMRVTVFIVIYVWGELREYREYVFLVSLLSMEKFLPLVELPNVLTALEDINVMEEINILIEMSINPRKEMK